MAKKVETIDGVTFTRVHSGQKREYGDSFYEYEVTSDLPADEVERVCREKIDKALPLAQYQAECKIDRSMDAHFRKHYRFTKRSDGAYFYSVCFPYAD